MELDPNQKREVLKIARSPGIIDECEACGAESFTVSDTADPVGEGPGGVYTAKVGCEECGTTARVFEVQESEL